MSAQLLYDGETNGTNLQEEMIFENPLHWQRQKITQFEPGIVGGHLTLLQANNNRVQRTTTLLMNTTHYH